jgi:hypothetical protein
MYPDINSNSKEVIKNRMLKHALTYWGIKNTEDLDPIVKLILEGLSSELYNLGNEIKDTQVRMLEKVASLLAPDFLTSPNPAHGILHASPVEPQELLTTATSFFAQRKFSSKQNEVLDASLDIFFNPVDAVQLSDVQIVNMATGGSLYSYDGVFNKQLIAKSKLPIKETCTTWLGLRVNAKLEHIKDLAFCFDWKNIEPKLAHHKYQLLPLAKWFMNDIAIHTKQGIAYPNDNTSGDRYENIFLEYDLLRLIEKDIKQYYHQKFVTVDAGSIQEARQVYPASFSAQFPETDLEKLNEKLLWIKIIFPAAISQESLEEVYIYPNAFPVVNRQLIDLKYRLKGGSNIIPLRTEMLDQFLSVKSLSDDSHQYKSVPYRKMEEEERGTYTLRNGGVERFDGRNARELISYLLELLRSESAAFSAYGYDFIAGTLKEMNQKISLMEQKTKGYMNNAAEIPNYIIVKPAEGHDMMYVEFWTTLAEVANNLRAGSRLQQAKGVKIKPESIMLMSTTIGGNNRLKPEERLNAFRYGIMTRNRIITKEDIRNFCFYELGERLEKVEIERGFDMSLKSKEAFRRTIDVILIPAEKDKLELKSWETLCEQLKSKLQNRSGVSNDYRVMVRES